MRNRCAGHTLHQQQRADLDLYLKSSLQRSGDGGGGTASRAPNIIMQLWIKLFTSPPERGGAHTAIKSIFVIMQPRQLFEPRRCGNGEIITIMYCKHHARLARCLPCARIVYICTYVLNLGVSNSSDWRKQQRQSQRERIPFQSTYLLATPIVQQLNAIHAVFIDFSNSKCFGSYAEGAANMALESQMTRVDSFAAMSHWISLHESIAHHMKGLNARHHSVGI